MGKKLILVWTEYIHFFYSINIQINNIFLHSKIITSCNHVFFKISSHSGNLLPLIVGISWLVSFLGSTMSLYLSPRCLSRYGPQLEAALQELTTRWREKKRKKEILFWNLSATIWKQANIKNCIFILESHFFAKQNGIKNQKINEKWSSKLSIHSLLKKLYSNLTN